jgi:hypothetical protein
LDCRSTISLPPPAQQLRLKNNASSKRE